MSLFVTQFPGPDHREAHEHLASDCASENDILVALIVDEGPADAAVIDHGDTILVSWFDQRNALQECRVDAEPLAVEHFIATYH